jgi:hypothetical protein
MIVPFVGELAEKHPNMVSSRGLIVGQTLVLCQQNEQRGKL